MGVKDGPFKMTLGIQQMKQEEPLIEIDEWCVLCCIRNYVLRFRSSHKGSVWVMAPPTPYALHGSSSFLSQPLISEAMFHAQV